MERFTRWADGLARFAERDPLTGLLNRRGLERAVAIEERTGPYPTER